MTEPPVAGQPVSDWQEPSENGWCRYAAEFITSTGVSAFAMSQCPRCSALVQPGNEDHHEAWHANLALAVAAGPDGVPVDEEPEPPIGRPDNGRPIAFKPWDGSTELATSIIAAVLGLGGTARYVGEGEDHHLRRRGTDTAPFIAVDLVRGATARLDPGDRITWSATHGCGIEAGSIVCPSCGAESWNPNDIAQRYCGRCHQFHDTMTAAAEHQERERG